MIEAVGLVYPFGLAELRALRFDRLARLYLISRERGAL